MGKEILTCRDVLWILVFCGFAINYMLRINLNLAIVAMVVPRSTGPAIAECSLEKISSYSASNSSLYMLTLPTITQKSSTPEYLFHWTEYDQGMALGAYYWFHWLTQLPGGLLARRYGTKNIFGIANLATGILGLLIPLATQYHLYGLVAIRALQGFISGVIWPSMHDMTAKWIPPMERSKFVSAYLGSSVGAAITYPLCAFMIDWINWRAAFYITSIISIIWYCFWYFLVYDTPKEHPRISTQECAHIVESLADNMATSQGANIPWRKLLLSGPVWIAIVAHWGGVWGFLTFMTQAPSYFNFVHGWNINATGLLSGLPHILRMIFSYIYSILSDWLLRTKKMSHQNVRKLANFVTTGGGAIFTLALSLSGCEPILAIIFMMAGTAINGAVSAGTLAIFVDLSPNLASVLLGFCGLVTTGAGFISPLIVGILTNHRQTTDQWRLVFMIAAANLTISALAYQFWGTAEVQSWNEYNEPPSVNYPNEHSGLKGKKKNRCDQTDKETGLMNRIE